MSDARSEENAVFVKRRLQKLDFCFVLQRGALTSKRSFRDLVPTQRFSIGANQHGLEIKSRGLGDA